MVIEDANKELPLKTPDCILEQLNETIQAAMGWAGDQLWVFELGKRELTDEESAYDLEMEEARRATLASITPRSGAKFRYTYDFGDDWHHRVTVERIVEEPSAGPSCLAGAGACPPKDVGGPVGYAQFLAVVRDPDHPHRPEWEEWEGFNREFDPGTFRVEEANARLARLW